MGNPHSWMVYEVKNPIKVDDWGYPYFRKPPYMTTSVWRMNFGVVLSSFPSCGVFG